MSDHLKIHWRRPRRALLVLELNSYPETPPPLNYPSILPPPTLRRRDIERLGLSAPPIPSRIAPPVTVAVYPSFVPPPILRRRDIKRFGLSAPPVPSRIAPPVTAVIYPAYVLERARLVVNDRVLITPRELNEYAEPIPPPDQPAWKLPPVLRWRFIRTRLNLPHVDVFPLTPPSNARSLHGRAFTTREQASRRIQRIPPVAEFTAAVGPAPFTAYKAVSALRRRETTRTHYHAPDIPPRIAPPVTAVVVPSFFPPPTFKVSFERSLQRLEHTPDYQTPLEDSGFFPAHIPFPTLVSTFKRVLQDIEHTADYQTIAEDRGFYPAHLPGPTFLVSFKRTLRRVEHTEDYQTPLEDAGFFPAHLPGPTFRSSFARDHQHAPPIPSRIAPPITAVEFPAGVPPPTLRWSFKRALQSLEHTADYQTVLEDSGFYPAHLPGPTFRVRWFAPRRLELAQIPPRIAPPVTAALYPSYLPPEANQSDFHRRPLSVPKHDQYTATPPPTSFEEYTAWLPPITHRVGFKRSVITTGLDEYPVTPTGVSPYPSWVPPKAFRTSFKREVQPVIQPYRQAFVVHLSYRWYSDDNADVNATTALAAQGGDIVISDLSLSYHLRFKFRNTGTEAAAGTFQLRVQKNGGGAADVDGASANVRAAAGLPADGDPTTKRLTGQPLFEFAAGEYDEVDGAIGADLPGGDQTEHVFSIQFVAGDVKVGDRFTFQPYLNGASSGPLATAVIEIFPATELLRPNRTLFNRQIQSSAKMPVQQQTLRIASWRWYDNDNADVDLTTAAAPQDTNYIVKGLGESWHLRIKIENTGTVPASGDFKLFQSKNGGPFSAINGPDDATVIAGLPADGDATAERLTGSLLPFVAGTFDDVDGAHATTIPAGRQVELVWSLEFIAADNGGADTYRFRVQDQESGLTIFNVSSTPTAQIEGYPSYLAPITHRVSYERKLQNLPQLDEHPPTPPPTAQEYTSWALPPTHRTSFKRNLLTRPLDEYPASPAPPAPPYPSWVPPAQHSIRFDRKLQPIAEIDEYPATDVNLSKVSTPVIPFVTRSQRSRRRLTLPHNPVYEFVPQISEAPITAWMLPVHHYRPQPQGLFLTHDAAFRARAIVPWPSYARVTALHTSFERKLIKPLHSVPWPHVPAITAVEYPAHLPPPTHRQKLVRQIQKLPQTPDRVLLAPPYSAWTIEPDYHLFAHGLDRRHLHAGFPHEYPESPALPPLSWAPKDDKGPLTGAPKDDGGPLTIGSCEDGGSLIWTPHGQPIIIPDGEEWPAYKRVGSIRRRDTQRRFLVVPVVDS